MSDGCFWIFEINHSFFTCKHRGKYIWVECSGLDFKVRSTILLKTFRHGLFSFICVSFSRTSLLQDTCKCLVLPTMRIRVRINFTLQLWSWIWNLIGRKIYKLKIYIRYIKALLLDSFTINILLHTTEINFKICSNSN